MPQISLSHISSPLNNSLSKEAHIFPRADRFSRSRRMHTQFKYALPSTLDKKTCGIGYGKKSSLVLDRYSPPPGTYQNPSQFHNSKGILSRSPSFAKGRQAIIFRSYLDQAQAKSKRIPSPNKYDIKLPRRIQGGRIAERLDTDPIMKESKRIPGPGSYQLEKTQMSNSQSYVLSTFKKSSSPRYYQQKTIEISRIAERKVPFYELSDKHFGKSKVSKFRNGSAVSFGMAKRGSLVERCKLQVPGFKYGVFSEFGQMKK